MQTHVNPAIATFDGYISYVQTTKLKKQTRAAGEIEKGHHDAVLGTSKTDVLANLQSTVLHISLILLGISFSLQLIKNPWKEPNFQKPRFAFS
jgi:hypothetical protein